MKKSKYLIFIVIFASLSPLVCAAERDPHSNSRPEEISTKSVALDLNVNFETKIISGSVTFDLQNKTGARRFYLDTKDLIIESVTASPGNVELKYELGASDPVKGEALIIYLPNPKQNRYVTVNYQTKSSAAGLNWMNPEQTISKKPFLFSLSAPIFSRTWMPCLDTPSVRSPYRAKIKTRKDLLAVMSAKNPSNKSPQGIYEFEMPEPVPAYLIALAVGDLEFRKLGPRSGVYAEPGIVDAAAKEFVDSEKILKATEKMFGPFLWERADLLILPYSFAYGGMENPRLTFLNAATVVGDRSMVNIVAHEYAHYWSGNLVLPSNWNHFWLNEGVTSYAEVRILESVYGKSTSQQMLNRNMGELQKVIADLKDHPDDTHLKLNLAGRDPDDGINDIAYQKGAMFLRMIEQIVGRNKFDKFLQSYFKKFKFQSITSDDFVNFLNQTLLANDPSLAKKLQVNDWVYGSGIPSNAPSVESDRVDHIENIAKLWKQGVDAKSLDVIKWSAFDWQNFLDILGNEVPASKMIELDKVFQLSQKPNPEVRYRWLKLVIQNKYSEGYPLLKDFLSTIGRGKYVKPLYKMMSQTPEGLKMGREIFAIAKNGYHPVVQNACEKMLVSKGD